MSEWSRLPNAHHIDRILKSLPNLSSVPYCDPTFDPVYEDAWSAAFNEVFGGKKYDAYLAARREAYNVTLAVALVDYVYSTGRDAILALVAYENCAYMLQEKPEYVEVLASLGVDGAILLLPIIKGLTLNPASAIIV